MSIKLLIVIGNISIYKTYVIKKMQITPSFFKLKKKGKNLNTTILIRGPFYVRGLRPWPKWPRPRPRASPGNHNDRSLYFYF